MCLASSLLYSMTDLLLGKYNNDSKLGSNLKGNSRSPLKNLYFTATVLLCFFFFFFFFFSHSTYIILNPRR